MAMLFRGFTYSPMPAAQDELLQLVVTMPDGALLGCEYQINGQHRDNNPNKAKWHVDCETEVVIFAGSMHYGDIEPDGRYAGGLFIPNAQPEVLGVTKTGEQSKLAIFDNGVTNGFWHGYPANLVMCKK